MKELFQERDAVSRLSPIYDPSSYERLDEKDDTLFYNKERFVEHLDSLALKTVEHIIGSLIIEENPVILDLMAGWDSHIPMNIRPSKVIGIGLNEKELKANKSLTEFLIRDINKYPNLPFQDNFFDVVLNTVSVDYITRPIEVFREVNRILKPGGIFIVIFSNRMFPQKAIKMWRLAGEDERVIIVEDYFKETAGFEMPSVFVSKGKPRPADDKYACHGIGSDPVYAVYSQKLGGPSARKRPIVKPLEGFGTFDVILKSGDQTAVNGPICPHCGKEMKKWQVPENPFCQTWDNEYMYICFNDQCPYFIRGWDVMYNQTYQTMSYRCMFNPKNERFSPIPVPTPRALKDGIIE